MVRWLRIMWINEIKQFQINLNQTVVDKEINWDLGFF